MRRQESGDLRKSGKTCSRRCGLTEKRFSVFAQEEDCRDLACLIGRFPVPGAAGVGCAEGCFHGCTEDRGVDALTAFEMIEKL